jgi:peptidoglycan/LPS O-acetylase OafA/YrhL
VASSSYYVIETPFLRLKDRFGSSQTRHPGQDRSPGAPEAVVTRSA